MNRVELIQDLNREFNPRGFVLNTLTSLYDHGKLLCTAYRPVSGRGRDQVRCLMAHYLQWIRHGNTQSYCHSCPSFVRMTCIENVNGYSDECGRGHYRFEAT